MDELTTGHTVRKFDRELSQLRGMVLEMGELVCEQAHKALEALEQQNIPLTRQILHQERQIDEVQVKADETCIHLIATRQPAGRDLRFVMAAFKIITDLERIGDQAAKIAQMTQRLFDNRTTSPQPYLIRDVLSMGRLALALLDEALTAFSETDYSLSVRVMRKDSDLDQEFMSALRHLSTFMLEDARSLGNVIDAVFIVHALERIGDHAKNIAEYTIFAAKGLDVRYRHPDFLPDN